MGKNHNQSHLSRLLVILLSASIGMTPSALAETPSTAGEFTQDSIDETAKPELPEDWYSIYRIVDRIARANQLDNTTWRVVIVPEYDINAFTSESNLIAIDRGIIDQLVGDASAIACGIAHEMAHHVKAHSIMTEAEKTAAIAQYEQEARAEVMGESEKNQNQGTGSAVGGTILRGIGWFFGGIGAQVGNIGGAVLDNVGGQQQPTDPQQRIEEIVALKIAELEKRLAQESRDREFEADEVGYQYIVKAGFETEGCLRLMEILPSTPGSQVENQSPTIAERIEHFKGFMRQYPPTILGLEGKTYLLNSQPLTYDLSPDGLSLRIHSQRGGSTSEDLDRLFGQ